VFAFGWTNAVILQEIHWWCGVNERKNQNFKNGFAWVYNTRAEWGEKFWFMNERTIWDALGELRKSGVVIAESLCDDTRDRTLWYRINYKVFETHVQKALDQHAEKALSHDAGLALMDQQEKALMQGYRKGADVYKEAVTHTNTHTDTKLPKIKTASKERLPIPDKLTQVPGFVDAWDEWSEFRAKVLKKPCSRFSDVKQFKVLLADPDPIRCIETSINGTWSGIFPSAKKNVPPPAAYRTLEPLEDD
jgi:hypothetical protein